MATTILWFRQDLRLADNPALQAALRGGAVVPVFVWSPQEEGAWAPGAASRWWLHRSLAALDESLRRLGSRLVIRRGESLAELLAVARDTGATAVAWNRRYEPAVVARDTRLKAALREAGLDADSFNAALLNEPWTIANRAGGPFQVFTPFWRHCSALAPPARPEPAPAALPGPARWPASLRLDALGLLPRLPWADAWPELWRPGEAGAHAALARFVDEALDRYDQRRDLPAESGTSRLSPHLHFGEIGPRQVVDSVMAAAAANGLDPASARHSRFLTEIGWREFSHHLLWHFPRTPEEPLRQEFMRFPWLDRPAMLEAWQRGRTGFPIVDAGMRELWATGWMHNRVRMIVASFLVKDLLVRWQDGARWFWDTLVDADLAQNTLGWQWSAGCGADAAPFFRVFNPCAQGQKFDAGGQYVRRWCPELSRLPDRWLHAPWLAPAAVLAAAGLPAGSPFASPVVDHAAARTAALEAFRRLRVADAPATRIPG